MSAGKIAAQSFQASQRLFAAAAIDAEHAALLERWQWAGTCTRVRIALSAAVFERARRELAGVTMIDEGMNEVGPNSATCFATWPLEGDLPRMLKHKRIPVLNALIDHGHARQGSRRYVLTAAGSNPAVSSAREAELAQHHALRSAEVAGSKLASGLALEAT